VPWLRRLVVGLSPRRPRLDPGSVHVGFVVDKVVLGHVFPQVLRFSPVNFIPPMLHYKEKRKNTKHLHHRFAQAASSLRCVRSICCGPFTPPPPQKKGSCTWSPNCVSGHNSLNISLNTIFARNLYYRIKHTYTFCSAYNLSLYFKENYTRVSMSHVCFIASSYNSQQQSSEHRRSPP
jgi:hypothetical protein